MYSIDTSGRLDGWERDYPIDVFPRLWEMLDRLVSEGKIISSEEVYVEVEKKSDGVHTFFGHA